MDKTLSFVVAVLLLGLTPPAITAAQTPANQSNVELQFGGKSLDPSGTVRADGSTSGSSVDVESDLDLKTEDALVLGLRTQSRRIRGFRASYSNFVFEGKNDPSGSFTYNDEAFSNPVKSELDFTFYNVDLEYRLSDPARDDFFNFVFGGRYIEFAGTIERPSTGRTARSSFETGIPVLGVTARKYLAPKLFIQGRWQGMDATLDDNELQYLDGEVGVGFNPFGKLWLLGSYSDLRIEGTNNNDHFDLTFTGPSARAIVYF